MLMQSIAQIKKANDACGQCFFAEAAMEFFQSKVESPVFFSPTCSYFVTSEQDSDGKIWFGNRRFTIRMAHPNGCITTVGEFGQHFTYEEAQRAILDLIRTA